MHKINTETIPEDLPVAYPWVNAGTVCFVKKAEETTAPITYPTKSFEDDTATFICSSRLPKKINIAEAIANVARSSRFKSFFQAILLDWAMAYSCNDLTRSLFPDKGGIVQALYQQHAYSVGVSASLMKKHSQLSLSSLIPPSGGVLVWADAPIELD